MYSTILYYDAVNKFLEKGGYKLGFECFDGGVTDLHVCSYWHLGRNVVLVKHSEGIIKYVKLCNSGEKISSFGSDRQTLVYFIEMKLRNLCDAPPSVLGTFDDVLFKSYDSNVDKYDKLMQSVNQFSPEFLELFQDEISQMTSDETSVATTVGRWQWFQNSQGKYCYATDIIGNTACIKEIGGIVGNKLDFRELKNSYRMIDTPAAIGQLLQMVLRGCHEIFNVQELVPILQTLGCENLEEFSKIEKPVVFDGADCLDYYMDTTSIIYNKELLFKCDGFCVKIATDIDLFFHLMEGTGHSVTGQLQSIREVIEPYRFYETVKDLVCNILEKFNMVLRDQQLLHTYLYQLLGALESVKPSKNISYEATWDDYPVPGDAVTDTTKGRPMISEMQPSRMQF